MALLPQRASWSSIRALALALALTLLSRSSFWFLFFSDGKGGRDLRQQVRVKEREGGREKELRNEKKKYLYLGYLIFIQVEFRPGMHNTRARYGLDF